MNLILSNCNCNFNKKQEKSQERKVKFFLERLPKRVRAFKTKGGFKSNKKYCTCNVIETHKFVEFNRETLNFLVVDIDNRKLKLYEIFALLKERNILPTYIVFTDRGYQVGWALEHPFVLNREFQNEIDKRNEKYARYILKKLSYLLGGDSAALRLRGVWRNPLANKSLIYTSKKYLLDELDIYIDRFERFNIITEGKIKVHKDLDKIKDNVYKLLINPDIADFVEVGERNTTLWYLGMFKAKEILENDSNLSIAKKRRIFKKEVKNLLFATNALLKVPLSKKEVRGIVNSVENYFLENRVWVAFGQYEEWKKEFRNKYMKEYRKKRGLTKSTREETKKNSVFKVIKVLEHIQYSSKNISKVCREFNISKSTFYKYKKILEANSKSLLLLKLLVSLQKKDFNKKTEVFVSIFYYSIVEYILFNLKKLGLLGVEKELPVILRFYYGPMP